jgi:hypothetical protein
MAGQNSLTRAASALPGGLVSGYRLCPDRHCLQPAAAGFRRRGEGHHCRGQRPVIITEWLRTLSKSARNVRLSDCPKALGSSTAKYRRAPAMAGQTQLKESATEGCPEMGRRASVGWNTGCSPMLNRKYRANDTPMYRRTELENLPRSANEEIRQDGHLAASSGQEH